MAEQISVFFYGLSLPLEANGLRQSKVRQAHVQPFEMRLGERATLVLAEELAARRPFYAAGLRPPSEAFMFGEQISHLNRPTLEPWSAPFQGGGL